MNAIKKLRVNRAASKTKDTQNGLVREKVGVAAHAECGPANQARPLDAHFTPLLPWRRRVARTSNKRASLSQLFLCMHTAGHFLISTLSVASEKKTREGKEEIDIKDTRTDAINAAPVAERYPASDRAKISPLVRCKR